MPSKKLDFDSVREIVLTLTDVQEGSLHGAPSIKVHGRLLACPAIHKSAEPDSLAVRIDFQRRAEMIAEEPNFYYVTDHYLNYPTVLVRLSRIDRDSLTNLLRMAWRSLSLKRKQALIEEFSHDPSWHDA